MGQGENFLITGPPGIGKTTFMRRLWARVKDLGPQGFYTEEILRGTHRVGFRLVGLDGREAVLAHIDIEIPRRVGRYGVDVRALDDFLKGVPRGGMRLLLLDEIGKMECFSPSFRGLVHHWLAGPAVVVATVAERGTGLVEEVKARDDCELYLLNHRNADGLIEEIDRRVREALPE
jgi:nucleoside-triphosphatase